MHAKFIFLVVLPPCTLCIEINAWRRLPTTANLLYQVTNGGSGTKYGLHKTSLRCRCIFLRKAS
eukprot:COSAG02_NODE_2902_length_7777_cov_3.802292_9_plen_64_part_00